MTAVAINIPGVCQPMEQFTAHSQVNASILSCSAPSDRCVEATAWDVWRKQYTILQLDQFVKLAPARCHGPKPRQPRGFPGNAATSRASCKQPPSHSLKLSHGQRWADPATEGFWTFRGLRLLGAKVFGRRCLAGYGHERG
jgi:hypothetical protein